MIVFISYSTRGRQIIDPLSVSTDRRRGLGVGEGDHSFYLFDDLVVAAVKERPVRLGEAFGDLQLLQR